jgi:hypothetical protein
MVLRLKTRKSRSPPGFLPPGAERAPRIGSAAATTPPPTPGGGQLNGIPAPIASTGTPGSQPLQSLVSTGERMVRNREPDPEMA